MSITKYLSLALAVAVAACETPAGALVGPGNAQFAGGIGQSVNVTFTTIDAPSLTAGQPGEIVAHLWWDGHPLGGKDMNLYIDGALIDSKHGSKLGTVTFVAPGLAGGQHTVKVTFDGNKNFFGSEATITVTVR
jgi:hypothetical protein